LIPVFPHADRNCWRCANCKKKQLSSPENKGKMLIYIGDGLSDLCPASHADLVFAKGSLLKQLHLRKTKNKVVAFKKLKKVYEDLRRMIREPEAETI
jgi:2-hydroxy-3-keto-5-methylthiopentenyl-1-phosphate phosphatase